MRVENGERMSSRSPNRPSIGFNGIETVVGTDGTMSGGFSKVYEIQAAAPDAPETIGPGGTTNNCLGGNCVAGCGHVN